MIGNPIESEEEFTTKTQRHKDDRRNKTENLKKKAQEKIMEVKKNS